MSPVPRPGSRGQPQPRPGSRGQPQPRPGSRGQSQPRPGRRGPWEPRPDRRGLGGEQVEGRRAVRELLAAGRRRVHEVWVSEGSRPSDILAEIIDLAAQRRVRVRNVAPDRLEAAAQTEAPQGLLARADPLPEAALEDLVRPRPDGGPPFLLALDGVSDPHNLGAVLRSGESAGVTGAVLPRHRAVQVTATVAKVAAGAIEHVPMAVVPGLPAALATMSKAGVWSVGLDPGVEHSVFDLPVGTEPVALVLGSEGRGLSRLARQRCDLVVAIPQRGSLSSLNVSAAAAVACYEIARRRLSQ